MARDYFAILGLSPGRHDPQTIARRFLERRNRLLGRLHDGDEHEKTRRRLDDLHLAYAALRDPRRIEEHLRDGDAIDRVTELRRLITASLENGLLRHSRRQAILERAHELGFGEFQAQLMIAQVQFGDEQIPALPTSGHPSTRRPHPRTWARLAATGVLALAMFLYMVHWVGN